LGINSLNVCGHTYNNKSGGVVIALDVDHLPVT